MFAVCGEIPLAALAETTMADVPAGVPGLRGTELPPPPQPIKQIPAPRQIMANVITRNERNHCRFLLRPRSPTIPPKLINAPAGTHGAGARGMRSSLAVAAAVAMVS
jgi:hypothetical protein